MHRDYLLIELEATIIDALNHNTVDPKALAEKVLQVVETKMVYNPGKQDSFNLELPKQTYAKD